MHFHTSSCFLQVVSYIYWYDGTSNSAYLKEKREIMLFHIHHTCHSLDKQPCAKKKEIVKNSIICLNINYFFWQCRWFRQTCSIKMQYKLVSKQSNAGNFKPPFVVWILTFSCLFQKARSIFQSVKILLCYIFQTSWTKKVFLLLFIDNTSVLALIYVGNQKFWMLKLE